MQPPAHNQLFFVEEAVWSKKKIATHKKVLFSDSNPALLVVTMQVICETPRSRRLAQRNLSKQAPQPVNAVEEKTIALSASTAVVCDENTANAESENASRPVRTKREFKRRNERPQSDEETEQMQSAVEVIAEAREPTVIASEAQAPVSTVEENTEIVSSAQEQKMEVIEAEKEDNIETKEEITKIESSEVEPSSQLVEVVETVVEEIDKTIVIPEIPNANEQVAEALQQKRQARAKKGRAKKAEAVVPVAAVAEIKRVSIANDPWKVDDIDFGMLDEAVNDAFIPREKEEAEARELARRIRGRNATKDTSNDEDDTKESGDDSDSDAGVAKTAGAKKAGRARPARAAAKATGARNARAAARLAQIEAERALQEAEEKEKEEQRNAKKRSRRESSFSSSSSSSSSRSSSISSSSSSSDSPSDSEALKTASAANSPLSSPFKDSKDEINTEDDVKSNIVDYIMSGPSPKRRCTQIKDSSDSFETASNSAPSPSSIEDAVANMDVAQDDEEDSLALLAANDVSRSLVTDMDISCEPTTVTMPISSKMDVSDDIEIDTSKSLKPKESRNSWIEGKVDEEASIRAFEDVESEIFGDTTDVDNKMSVDAMESEESGKTQILTPVKIAAASNDLSTADLEVDSPLVRPKVQEEMNSDLLIAENDLEAQTSVSQQTVLPTNNSQRFAMIPETPSKLLKRVSDAVAPVQARAATTMTRAASIVPSAAPANNGKTSFANNNAAAASRLNERIARIQENKAELEAKKRRELEAKQLKDKEREKEKEKSIRERLDTVLRRTETAKTLSSTSNTVTSSASQKPAASNTGSNDLKTSSNANSHSQASHAAPSAPISASIVSPIVSPAPKKVFEERRNVSQLKQAIENVIESASQVRASMESVDTPPPPKSSTKTKTENSARPRPADLAPWPPVGVPEIRTPPSSPNRSVSARTPPSLANTSALKLKKSTPRRFLPGFMSKEKTPAKATPSSRLLTPQMASAQKSKMPTSAGAPNSTSSASKKGFWGNILGLFGNKRADGMDMSDSPLFVPNQSTLPSNVATIPEQPDFGAAMPASGKKLKDSKSNASTATPSKAMTSKRAEASWSPLVAPVPISRALADDEEASDEKRSSSSLSSSISLDDDSVLMPPPHSATNGSHLSKSAVDEYRAGIRSVPLLDSTSDDEDASRWFENSDEEGTSKDSYDDGESSDEERNAKIPKIETFEVRAGGSTTAAPNKVTLPSATATNANNLHAKATSEYAAAAKALKTPEKLVAANPFWRTPETQVCIVTPKKGHDEDDDDESYDSEEDSEEILKKHRRKRPALWTKSEYLQPVLESQYAIDPEDVFGSDFPATCDLTDIFSEVKVRIMSRARTSSGFWSRDKLTLEEKREYKRRMGFTVKSLEKDERR